MALRKIVTFPNEVLRNETSPVTEFDDALQVLVDDMIETMREAPGLVWQRRRSGSLNGWS